MKLNKIRPIRNIAAAIAAIIVVAVATHWAVNRFETPGHLDLIAAQAMDMSSMHPPVGAAPVELATIKRGSLDNIVTYTGTVQAFNEQAISPRVAGTLIALPVYPGDHVRAGQVVARLDTAELAAKTAQQSAFAAQAESGIAVARLTVLRAKSAIAQADAEVSAAAQSVTDSEAQADAAQAMVNEAKSGVVSAQAQSDYWKTQIVSEKQLVDKGFVARQDYESQLAKAHSADASLVQAQAKVARSIAQAQSAKSKIVQAQKELSAMQAARRTASAGAAIAAQQVTQQSGGTDAARAAAREAAVVQGYARITSPANGVVTTRPIAPGTLVQPGAVILTIAEIGKVRLQANVAASDLAGIHVGSPVQAAISGGSGRALVTHISAIFPAADQSTHTAVVEAIVANPGQRLLPGQFVTMKITKSSENSKLLAPAAAVEAQDGQSYLWIADNQVARRLPISVGASDGALTEVSGTNLSAGMQVIMHGQAGLSPGTRVAASRWGANGPKSLPTAAAIDQSETRYKCTICGLIYSAADAKKDNYVCPMDHGKLVPMP